MESLEERHLLLDKILELLRYKGSMGLEGLCEQMPDVSSQMIVSLLQDLQKADYIKTDPPYNREITTTGVDFISKGGYKADRKRQKESAYITKSSYRWTKIGVWLSTVLALASLIYSIVSDLMR